MGKFYLLHMFGIIVITFLLFVRLCECFPQLNDNKIIVGNKNLEPMVNEGITGDVEIANSASVVAKDHISDSTELDGIKFGHPENFNPKNAEAVLRSIRVFTETSIINILKNYFNNLKSSAKTIVGKADVILSAGNSSHVIQTNTPTMKSQAPVLEVINNKIEQLIHSAVGKQTKTIKMPAPAKSTIDRWLPGLRSYRRKRSYYADLGLDLESAFSVEPTDIVYGAHTSPCDKSDRHYCLNGGTCVFVGALEIKTCRCKIGYNGLRCESINQDFLLALLTEGLFL